MRNAAGRDFRRGAATDEKCLLKAALGVASVGMPDEAVTILEMWLTCRTPAEPPDPEAIAVLKRTADELLRLVLDVMTALCSMDLVDVADVLWRITAAIWAERNEEWEDTYMPF